MIDMAVALKLPITQDAEGRATMPPEQESRLNELHRKMQFVVQAYLEHARLEPGRWSIAFGGWQSYYKVRCKPPPHSAIDAYRDTMARIAKGLMIGNGKKGRRSEDVDSDRFSASYDLFQAE